MNFKGYFQLRKIIPMPMTTPAQIASIYSKKLPSCIEEISWRASTWGIARNLMSGSPYSAKVYARNLHGYYKRLAEGYAAHSDWEQAIAYTRRWVALDRLHEPAQRFLISLYGQAGQRSASLKQYDELVRILHDELGQEPEPETTALYHRIRDGAVAPAQDQGKDAPKARTAPQFAEPLLKTKLYIPSSRGQKVYRQYLIHQLNQIEQYSLAILSAPAGFGKTTSLVEWASQSSLPVGWYSLDSGDNEVVRFLTYLIAALESIQSGIGMDAQSLLRAPQPAPPQLVLTHINQ